MLLHLAHRLSVCPLLVPGSAVRMFNTDIRWSCDYRSLAQEVWYSRGACRVFHRFVGSRRGRKMHAGEPRLDVPAGKGRDGKVITLTFAPFAPAAVAAISRSQVPVHEEPEGFAAGSGMTAAP